MDTGRLSSQRARVDQLAAQPFDILVIGAGATGTAIAHEAAARGLKTALVDRGDVGGHGHSLSNPLVPIGLRSPDREPLQRLFQESRERHPLRGVAGHLAHRIPFIYPVYRKAKVPPLRLAWVVGADVARSAFRNVCQHRLLGKRAMAEREPRLRDPGLKGGIRFFDIACDRARLAVAQARAASQHGALVTTYVNVEELTLRDGSIRGVVLRDLRGEARVPVAAQMVINATGAWADTLRRLESRDAASRFELRRATQLTIAQDRLGVRHALRLPSPLDDRLLLVWPTAGHVVVGTAHTSVADPSAVHPSEADIAYLLRCTNAYFPNAHVTPEDVGDIRTAVIAQPVEGSGTNHVDISTGKYGMITVIGGFPSQQAVAVEVIDQAGRTVGERQHDPHASDTGLRPLPGAEAHDYVPLQAPGLDLGLPAATVDRLIGLYGTEAAAVYNLVRDQRDLMTPLHPDHPAIGAEVVHCARRELVSTVEDVLSRRLRVRGETQDGGQRSAALVAVLMGTELGWDRSRIQAEAEAYHAGAGDG